MWYVFLIIRDVEECYDMHECCLFYMSTNTLQDEPAKLTEWTRHIFWANYYILTNNVIKAEV